MCNISYEICLRAKKMLVNEFVLLLYDCLINKLPNTGTNISVYHDFIDEVDSLKKHIWRCNGPCQQRKPYYGYLKRAVNRKPGPSDFWWRGHMQDCGGTYLKVSPETTAPAAVGAQPRKKSAASSVAASTRMCLHSTSIYIAKIQKLSVCAWCTF